MRVAAYLYGVCKSSISQYQKGQTKPVGRPTQLTGKEEQALVDHLALQGDWGFPLTQFELQILVKDYLDKSGKKDTRFKNNVPGIKWLKCFLNRHQELKKRLPKRVSVSRAKVSPATVKKYFENLQETVKDVPPENIVNYDETNLTDDPGNKDVIVRRTEKDPQKIVTTSKTATSLMFAGTASGELFPVYVVYKSKELMEAWTTDGPRGARYNRTKSGWFDAEIFEDWFKSVVLPWAKKLPGRKVLIGDNVSSHFNSTVIELCKTNDISFVCLPPNSTHLLQPLDVAFFSPLKQAWKKILRKWKEDSRNYGLTLPKNHFPGLLKNLLEEIAGRSVRNLKTAFRTTGIFPLNAEPPLQRIPGGVQSPSREDVYRRVSETFLQTLTEKRFGDPKNAKKGKRLKVSPGKSWSDPSLTDAGPSKSNEDVESKSDPDDPPTPVASRRGGRRPVLRRAQRRDSAAPAPADESVNAAQTTQEDQSAPSDSRAARCARRQLAKQPPAQPRAPASSREPLATRLQPEPGDWVLIEFAKKRTIKYSVGLVTGIDEHHELICKFVKKVKENDFVWPEKARVLAIDYDVVEKVLSSPSETSQ